MLKRKVPKSCYETFRDFQTRRKACCVNLVACWRSAAQLIDFDTAPSSLRHHFMEPAFVNFFCSSGGVHGNLNSSSLLTAHTRAISNNFIQPAEVGF